MKGTVEERFWAKVAIGAPTECWLWTASRKPSGYGQFKMYPGESPRRASRVAWELTFGPIPADMIVRHSCDNPPCVNPAHLLLGTHANNTQDKVDRGRCPRPLASAPGPS